MKSPPKTLYIGGSNADCFRGITLLLSKTSRNHPFINLQEAENFLVQEQAEGFPDVIFIAVEYPGQFRNSAVEQLRTRYPLIKIVALLGTWCEGETRTGNPWDAEDRIFWYHFEWWWQAQLEKWRQGRLTSWQTPLTTIEVDRLAGPHFFKDTTQQNITQPTVQQSHAGVHAVVETADYETAATFAFMLKPFGYETIWQQPQKTLVVQKAVQLAIWNGGQLEGDELERLTAFYKKWHPARVVALLDFPRVETTKAISAIGDIAILGKPYSMDAFAAVLPTLTTRHKSRSVESRAANPPRESANK